MVLSLLDIKRLMRQIGKMYQVTVGFTTFNESASHHKTSQDIRSAHFNSTQSSLHTKHNHITSHHMISSHITSHHITSHHITLHHITSHHITLHHITSHHITSHYITSHHITSHYITSHHIKATHPAGSVR